MSCVVVIRSQATLVRPVRPCRRRERSAASKPLSTFNRISSPGSLSVVLVWGCVGNTRCMEVISPCLDMFSMRSTTTLAYG